MKSKKFLTLFLMMNVGIASTAIAGHHTEEGFFKRDTNGDGVVSKGEYLLFTEHKFKKIDVNGDGEIDKSEHKNSMNKWKKKHKQHHRHDKDPEHK